MANILTNPSAINVAPWSASGTGVSTPSATTLQTAASTASSLAQTVSVTSGLVYSVTGTVQGGAAAGTASLTIYKTDFSTNYGQANITLTTSPQVMSFSTSAIPGGVTSVIFEYDFNSTGGAIETITASALNSPSSTSSIGSLMLLGCGS